jgi:RNase adapter protein RapZ
MRLIVITGQSGSGKSVALRAMEDAGLFCIDNLPADLIAEAVTRLESGGYGDVAVSIDARSAKSLDGVAEALRALAGRHDVRVIYLEAKHGTLIKRFSETRRRHPLNTGDRSLRECIDDERDMLAPIAALAHHMDTSDLSANGLREWIRQFLGLSAAGFTLVFESFGFKQGVPLDADLVFDMRCLPNPFYDPTLRALTGLDAPVATFIEAQPRAMEMHASLNAFLDQWLPCYQRDNRSYFTVAMGCTGGQHRSVYFAESLAARFRARYQVLVRHRELS